MSFFEYYKSHKQFDFRIYIYRRIYNFKVGGFWVVEPLNHAIPYTRLCLFIGVARNTVSYSEDELFSQGRAISTHECTTPDTIYAQNVDWRITSTDKTKKCSRIECVHTLAHTRKQQQRASKDSNWKEHAERRQIVFDLLAICRRTTPGKLAQCGSRLCGRRRRKRTTKNTTNTFVLALLRTAIRAIRVLPFAVV